MKQLVKRIFFFGETARGSLFAVTFCIVGSWLWLTLFHMLWLYDACMSFNPMNERFSTVIMSAVEGLLVIWGYSTIVFLCACWFLLKSCLQKHNYRPLYLALISWVFVAIGVFVIAIITVILISELSIFISYSNSVDWDCISKIPSDYWWWGYLVALLSIVAGVLLLVSACAKNEGKPLRYAFGKTVIALWSVFFAGQILFLGISVFANIGIDETFSQVEKRFNYPLSIEGIHDFYQSQGHIDADFWGTFKKNSDALSTSFTVGDEVNEYWNRKLPEDLTPEYQKAFEDYCSANARPLQELEKSFDAIPPLPAYEFELKKQESLTTFLVPARKFANLEFSRLRVFLKKGSVQEARLAYQHLANCLEYMKREPWLIGSLVWIYGENLRLDAMENMLESRLLTNEDLQNLEKDLNALEPQIPNIHMNAMYTEAVFGQLALQKELKGQGNNDIINIWAFRWLCPQLWLHVSIDRQYMLKQYLKEDFTCFDEVAPTACIFSSMVLPTLKIGGYKFYALTARIRAMRALLMAEAYRRQHGDYPAELSNLPIDPFTGKPLLYKYGEFETVENNPFTDFSSEIEDSEPEVKHFKAVQVWSVGKNLQDDGGENKTFGQKDDPCARIMLE